MKICHITTVHPNRYDVRIFEKECSSLAESGFDVTLIVNDELPDEIKNGVKIVSLNQAPKNRIDRASRIARIALKKAIEIDADIYHIHDPELLQMAIKLKKRGKKVIFDSHEFTAMQILTKPYLPKFIKKTLSNIYGSYEKKALNKLSGLVYPCTYKGKDYFDNVNIPKVMVGNYPSKKILDEVIADCDMTERQSKVCYVGGISETRGIFQMVKGAALAGRKLVLIGEIPIELKTQLETMPEYEFVECLGKLPHDIAMKEAARCAVGLSLLQNQGQYAALDNLPTKLYEYMAIGIPTVVSDFPYYKKMLEKYKFGIAVDPADEQAIANAINEILSNSDLALEFAEEGNRAIKEDWNWELHAEKLVRFYKKMMA